MTLALLLRYWREIGIVSLALAFVVTLRVSLHEHDQRVAADAVAGVQSRRADSVIASVRPQLAHAETVYVSTTRTVTKTIARVDTLRDTVLAHLTDTVIVKQFVVATDSALHACTDLVTSCAMTKRLLETERDAWKAKALAIPAASAGHSKLVDLGLVALSGAAGYLLHR